MTKSSAGLQRVAYRKAMQLEDGLDLGCQQQYLKEMRLPGNPEN